ncbi:LuxR family transcriptional regulator [Bifidobacterium lemurum]|uniref:LuxR family transcriptional regulator n=1 Tax=Bifidobacterium lemurum TaxID=1603886 RepID=A0A261FUD0_9BIFI|nr:response regulator transcription factor [Bifidobacterium lemurum]OZG62545.1 LuxR family transcriptional regulator [Bifidobacterium lemurum]QOL33879.1 response regulator transcription factor [Bifidobacterium lemurum]
MNDRNAGTGDSVEGRDGRFHRYPVSYRIALLDNDRRALLSLQELVEQHLAPSQVIWTAERGEDAIGRCCDARQTPDLLVVDMSLEGLQGSSVCRRIRAQSTRPAILGITSFSLNWYRQKASVCGMQGLIGKSDDQEIAQAMRVVAAGGALPGFDTAQMAHLRLKNDHSLNLLLTMREEEIISLSAERGMSNQEIGDLLGIADATVRKHMQHIVAKLNANSVRHASAIWLNQAE